MTSDEGPPDRPRSRCRRVALTAGALGVLLGAYLLLWPTRVDPAAWTPPAAPDLTGPYAANDRLAEVEVLPVDGEGPEDVHLDAEGRILAGLRDGRLVRLQPDGSGQETLLDTGGRPLGLDADAEGTVYAAVAGRGLLRLPAGAREAEVVATEEGGVPFRFTNDVDVAPDGTVYFTDASHRWGVERFADDLIEHRPNGRLLAWDPETREVRGVLDDLWFANGVAVSRDGSFLLVAETGRYRVRRVWLTGERAGEDEVVAENLPGFPDGIARDDAGVFWLALAAPRDALVDGLLPRPFLRNVLARIPDALVPSGAKHALVLGLRGDGEVVANLQDASSDAFAPVTSVEPAGDALYLGSLSYPGLARLPRPEVE